MKAVIRIKQPDFQQIKWNTSSVRGTRHYGVLIYRASIGTITGPEKAELERLSIETPATLKKVCRG